MTGAGKIILLLVLMFALSMMAGRAGATTVPENVTTGALTVNIVLDSDPGAGINVSYAMDPYTAATKNYTVAATGPDSVQIWIDGISIALLDIDYTPGQAIRATLNFIPGDSMRSVIFNIVDNHSGMAATRFVLMPANSTGGATIGNGSVYTVTIGSEFAGNATVTTTPAPKSSGSGLVRNLRTNMIYDCIQWGIDNATSGDTLVVGYARFDENIVIDKALTVRANDSTNRPIIDGRGAGRVVDIAADGVALDGFVIRGSSAGGYGIYGHGSGITVTDCQATGNGHGLFFDGATGAVIESCDVGQNACGITFDGTTNSNIVGCTVSANTNYGIALINSGHNRAERNVVASNGGEGIRVTESDSNVLICNDIHDNGNYGVTMHCQFNQVYLNTFRSNSPGNAFYNPGNEPDNNLWHSDGPLTYRYNDVEYTGAVGNFWGTFDGPDADGDGISETQFLSGKIVDTKPLVVPGSEFTNVRKAGQTTESTGPGWTWLLLLAFIPLAGIVISYFAFVREK